MLAPGTRLATYEVRERLAVGGMGEVYLCRHRLLDRIDAVKVLRPHLARDEAFRRRFLREALSAARLRHPHLVTVYTADEIDGQLYLAMEYVPGADLGAILSRQGSLEPDRVVGLLAQVSDALDAAHRMRLTHRDVKPSNVLVERPNQPDEHAYLVDFGLSKSDHGFDQDITISGQVLGTVAYIAPEQLQGRPADARSDQYSLACMAFECLTGRLPFPRDEQLAVLSAHLGDPPPSATQLRPTLPTAVDAIIARGMAKGRADRFETCTAFVHALRDALAPASIPHGAVLRRPAPLDSPTPLDSPAPLGPPNPLGSPEPGEPRRNGAPARRGAASGRVASAHAAVASPPVSAAPASGGPARSAATGRATPTTRQAREVAESVRLCLAVVGGPDGGRVVPLPDGEHRVGRSRSAAGTGRPDTASLTSSIALADPHLDHDHLTLLVDGWSVQVSARAGESVSVNGEPVTGVWSLRPGQLIAAGTSLVEVRETNRLAGLGAQHPEPDPVTLARIVHDQPHAVRRGPQHPQAMSVRLGWQSGHPPTSLMVALGSTASIAIRGEPDRVGPLVRWLLAQAIGMHDPRDLSIAAAVAPVGSDSWGWLADAPHARPWTAPLSGPHVTTTPEGAAELVAQLRDLIEVRRLAAVGGPAHHALAVLPRVLVILDDTLEAPGAEYVSLTGPPLGVHVVRLVRPTDRAPGSCAVCVDVDPTGRELAIHVAGRPEATRDGTPDGVSVAYARDICDALAHS